MSEKRLDRHRMEHGKHEPQGPGEGLDREQHGHSEADHRVKQKNDRPDDSGHAQHNGTPAIDPKTALGILTGSCIMPSLARVGLIWHKRP